MDTPVAVSTPRHAFPEGAIVAAVAQAARTGAGRVTPDVLYHFSMYDRDSIFSKQVDQSVHNMELCVIKTPVRTPIANSICERVIGTRPPGVARPAGRPIANSICERVIGTLRRDCLDFVIPLNERHLYHILNEWVGHYNEGRPHMSLGPGIPQPRPALPVTPQAPQHQMPTGQRVVARSVLGGLHHDYRLAKRAA